MTSDRRFVSEAVDADVDSMVPGAAGEPAVPRRFRWRGRTFEIASIERAWKTSDAAHRAVGNVYLRRHWFDVVTAAGERMRLYAERGGRSRWFLHSWCPVASA